MRKPGIFRFIAVILPVYAAAGCATVPGLDVATGTSESAVLIGDIVLRVKCEIADSFDPKIDTDDFRWLAGWTAKVDLTLQANVAAGVAPSVTYTKFFRNAFNFAAGSTSLTNNTIAAVNQFVTLGAGANLGEQALRAEVVSFTLSLQELKRWRYHVALYEADPANPRVCTDPNGKELTGQLGLVEWIDSALDPVHQGILRAGYHPSPVTTIKPSSAVGAPKTGAAFAGDTLAYDEALKRLKAADDAARTAASAASASAAKIRDYIEQVRKAVAPYARVLEPELKYQIRRNMASLKIYSAEADGAAAIAAARAKEVNDTYVDEKDHPSTTVPTQTVTKAEGQKDEAIAQQQYAGALEAESGKVVGGLKHIDPPVDALLHSVQFVLSYGASISPNWTLLQWKGPSAGGAGLASAAGQRTHVLNIAIGPPGGSAEQNRLIQNQTVMSPH